MKYKIRINNPVIGVPITWLDSYDPEQFEIIGITNHGEMLGMPFTNNCFAEVNGERKYVRILIRWKPEIMPNIDNEGVITYA